MCLFEMRNIKLFIEQTLQTRLPDNSFYSDFLQNQTETDKQYLHWPDMKYKHTLYFASLFTRKVVNHMLMYALST